MTTYNRLFAALISRIEDELLSFDWSWKHLAEAAGVSVQTIYKFRDKSYKDSPRLRTVFKVAKAVGLEIEIKAVKRARRAA